MKKIEILPLSCRAERIHLEEKEKQIMQQPHEVDNAKNPIKSQSNLMMIKNCISS